MAEVQCDSFVNEVDFALIGQDRYTFAVLDRILRKECEFIRTDHSSLILCHSDRPHPVWIWTPDGIGEAEKERAWRVAEAHRPLSKGNRFNMKYELAEYFIEKGREMGLNAGIAMRLFAYDCPEPIAPSIGTDGELYSCTPEDLEEAVSFLLLFHAEIGDEAPSRERCAEKAREHIDGHTFFFWKNDAGKAVACCSCKRNQGLASIANVCTLPEERRKHYAQHMVYQVTKMVKDMGYTPMLYTDADYPASNACYGKIGYVLRGKLCTIGVIGQN